MFNVSDLFTVLEFFTDYISCRREKKNVKLQLIMNANIGDDVHNTQNGASFKFKYSICTIKVCEKISEILGASPPQSFDIKGGAADIKVVL